MRVALGAPLSYVSNMLPRRQFSLRSLFGLTTAVSLLVFAALNVNVYTTSNCGGNNEAQAEVKHIFVMLSVYATNSPAGEFSLATASSAQRKELAAMGRVPGRGARYYISVEPFKLDASERRIVAFCDRPYTNVPRYLIGKPPPSHAVAWSNGEVELISTRDFAALDLTAFVPLDELP